MIGNHISGYRSQLGYLLPLHLGNYAIALKLCQNMLIRDITIVHGSHFTILVTDSDNLTVGNVTLDADRDATGSPRPAFSIRKSGPWMARPMPS